MVLNIITFFLYFAHEKNDSITFTVVQVWHSLNISSKQTITFKFWGHEVGGKTSLNQRINFWVPREVTFTLIIFSMIVSLSTSGPFQTNKQTNKQINKKVQRVFLTSGKGTKQTITTDTLPVMNLLEYIFLFSFSTFWCPRHQSLHCIVWHSTAHNIVQNEIKERNYEFLVSWLSS